MQPESVAYLRAMITELCISKEKLGDKLNTPLPAPERKEIGQQMVACDIVIADFKALVAKEK